MAADLTAADRDRLLAALYEQAFGDRIDSTLTCAECARPWFRPSERWQAQLIGDPHADEARADGVSFRLTFRKIEGVGKCRYGI